MNIGILGGTFDPIHYGHLEIAKKAAAQFALDKVVFVPAYRPPHKDACAGMSTAETRFQMVEQALKEFPSFEASRIELDHSGISYTVETLQKFKDLYPQDELYLIIGADSWHHFETWHRPQDIKKLARLLVAPRKGYEIKPEEGVKAIEMDPIELSATEIRRKTARGESLEGDVSEPTRVMINQKKMYGES